MGHLLSVGGPFGVPFGCLWASLGHPCGSQWLPLGPLDPAFWRAFNLPGPCGPFGVPFGSLWAPLGTLGAPSGSLWGSIWTTLGCPWPKRSKSQTKVEKVSWRTPPGESKILQKSMLKPRGSQGRPKGLKTRAKESAVDCMQNPISRP